MEPLYDKPNKMTCAPSEDSGQGRHQPSLIRVSAVRLQKSLVLNYPLSKQWRLIRLGGCPGGPESLLGTQVLFLFFFHAASYWVWGSQDLNPQPSPHVGGGLLLNWLGQLGKWVPDPVAQSYACQPSFQLVTGFDPPDWQNILSWRLVMKSFLRPFSPYPWFK